jgi:hypothetical protein
MTRFNLSEWAVNNRAITVFFMLVCLIGGLSAYKGLGREEDPDFSIQTMVVQASWPGASVADTLTQLTDRLEKKLEETPNLDYLKSYTKPGQATIFVNLKESTPSEEIEDTWYQVRKKIDDRCGRRRHRPSVGTSLSPGCDSPRPRLLLRREAAAEPRLGGTTAIANGQLTRPLALRPDDRCS